MNYYIVISKEICEQRHVFLDYPTLPDGRRIITPRDLNNTKFSYGTVELLNEESLLALRRALEDAAETEAEQAVSEENDGSSDSGGDTGEEAEE